MSFRFDPDDGLVIVKAELKGHTLPPSSGVDGLLGVDFFRQQMLKIDFRRGEISME